MTKPHLALRAVGWILVAAVVVVSAAAGWSATTAGARWVGLGLAAILGSGVVLGLVLRGEAAARRRAPQVRAVAHPAGVRIVGLGVTDALVRIWLLGIVVGVGAAGVTALVHSARGAGALAVLIAGSLLYGTRQDIFGPGNHGGLLITPAGTTQRWQWRDRRVRWADDATLLAASGPLDGMPVGLTAEQVTAVVHQIGRLDAGQREILTDPERGVTLVRAAIGAP
jgi:hypothetical protein